MTPPAGHAIGLFSHTDGRLNIDLGSLLQGILANIIPNPQTAFLNSARERAV